MRKQSQRRVTIWCAIAIGFAVQNTALAQSSNTADCSQTFEQRGFEKHEGLFTLYAKSNDETFIELESDDFAQDFIFANYVDRGVAPIVGEYAIPKLIKFQKNGDKIEIVQTDSIGFFDDHDPLRRARRLTMSDATLAQLKLHTCSTEDRSYAKLDQAALTGLSKDFFAMMGQRIGGPFKWEKSSVKNWQVFSDNLSLSSEHSAVSRRRLIGAVNGGNIKVRIRHILLKRSDQAFVPRLSDPRVGYFGVLRRDLGDIDQSRFVTHIQRWKLEKKDPDAALSDPVTPITFWIENTTPTELKPYIRNGVLAWNEAFRAAGFSNAIEVHDQPDDADWEAGDISKNVIRWQAGHDSEGSIGFGTTVFDPVTGQILGADIVLSYAGFGNFVDDWRRFEEQAAPTVGDAPEAVSFSPNSDADQTLGKIANALGRGNGASYSSLSDLRTFATFVEASRIQDTATSANEEKIRSHNAAPDEAHDISLISDSDVEGGLPLSEEATSFANRLVEEVVTYLVLHEVGHTLGLAHNFSGSHWRSMDEIFDSEQTKGAISASVMDYLPINISPPGVAQGDFSNTRTGPYDNWAIEFGYRPELDDPVSGESAKQLLLENAGKPGLLFGGFAATAFDPRSLQSDLTRNPIEYAASRIALIENVSQQATENQNYDSQQQLLALYGELSSLLSESLNAITSQVNPYAISAPPTGSATQNSNSLLLVSPKDNQQAAIEALRELLFAPTRYEFSQDFLIKASADTYLYDFFAQQRMRTKGLVIQRLVDQRLLLRMHRASQFGGEYGPTEMLFDLKKAVFGTDLSPLARPDADRRDQQILFARKLADLVNRAGNEGGRPVPLFPQSERSIVSAAARPVLNELRRELLLPNPLLPREIRGHRQELRAILNSTR